MKLVLDTNRLIAALLKKSASRSILTSPSFEFYTPVELLAEVEKYKGYLLEKTRLDKDKFDDIQDELLENVFLVSKKVYNKFIPRAIEVMGNIDIKDAPFLAIGIALKLDGIWSDDKHFTKQDVLRTCTTRQMIDIMNAETRVSTDTP